jgi:hypothetical protein
LTGPTGREGSDCGTAAPADFNSWRFAGGLNFPNVRKVEVPNAIGGVKLRVDPQNVDEANRILDEAVQDEEPEVQD